jgi:enamine deaminase RidA (YjgF/YER057c/UK114 family)
MERLIINPWHWQEPLGFVQAHVVTGTPRLVFVAGQFAGDANGVPRYPGDLRAQLHGALDNLETVLHQAGLGLADVVRLNYYTTDVDGFLATIDVVRVRLAEAGCQPASTLLGVNRLAAPELLIEIEATAVAA